MREGQSIFHTDEGSGVAMIALHGWACDGSDWSWLAADLVADHRIVVPDLRGHGASTHRNGQRYTPRLADAGLAAYEESLPHGSHDEIAVGRLRALPAPGGTGSVRRGRACLA